MNTLEITILLVTHSVMLLVMIGLHWTKLQWWKNTLIHYKWPNEFGFPQKICRLLTCCLHRLHDFISHVCLKLYILELSNSKKNLSSKNSVCEWALQNFTSCKAWLHKPCWSWNTQKSPVSVKETLKIGFPRNLFNKT